MATRTSGGVDTARARLSRGVVAVAFGLLAWAGLSALSQEARGFALSWSIVGSAGALGALTTLLAARGWSRAAGPSGRRRALRLEGAARLLMALAAVAALAVGIASAPAGAERGFVVTISAVLAGALALYALVAGDLHRAARAG